MNITEFEQLIGQLMNPNNNLRDQAEGVFHQLKKNPDFFDIFFNSVDWSFSI